MPSAAAIEFAVKVVTATTGAAGTAKGGPEGALVQFLAAQLDVAFDLVAKGGKLTPAQLMVVLAQKGLAISNIVPVDSVQCTGSLASLGAGFASVALEAAIGPLGWAAIALTTASNMYSVYGSCDKPLRQLSDDAQNKALGLAAQFTTEFWDWYRANGGVVPPM